MKGSDTAFLGKVFIFRRPAPHPVRKLTDLPQTAPGIGLGGVNIWATDLNCTSPEIDHVDFISRRADKEGKRV